MKSTCRNRIRKSQKEGLQVKHGFDEKLFEEFKKIYEETMKRDNATNYYFFNDDFMKILKII